jgi:hypothetical protein
MPRLLIVLLLAAPVGAEDFHYTSAATLKQAGAQLPPTGKSGPQIIGIKITFKNGNTMEGILLEQKGDDYKIKVSPRGSMGISRRLLKNVEFGENDHVRFEKQAGALVPEDALGFWSLSGWARTRGLSSHANWAAERVIAADPDHALARAHLGYEQHNGLWLRGNELKLAKGMVKYKGRWYSAADYAAKLADDRAREERRAQLVLERERRLAAEAEARRLAEENARRRNRRVIVHSHTPWCVHSMGTGIWVRQGQVWIFRRGTAHVHGQFCGCQQCSVRRRRRRHRRPQRHRNNRQINSGRHTTRIVVPKIRLGHNHIESRLRLSLPQR